MQTFVSIDSSENFVDSRLQLLGNDQTALSSSSGTAFPTTNLHISMLCFRTDENKLYSLVSTGPDVWRLIFDLSSFIAYLESPAFTGNPQVPATSNSDNSALIASTAFVQALLATLVLKAGDTITGQQVVTTLQSSGPSGTNTGYKLNNGNDLGAITFGQQGATGATGAVGATGATGPAGPPGTDVWACACDCACG